MLIRLNNSIGGNGRYIINNTCFVQNETCRMMIDDHYYLLLSFVGEVLLFQHDDYKNL